MASSSTARWLAPVALVGAVVALIVVVSSGGGSSDDTDTSPASTQTTRTTRTVAQATTTTTSPASAARRTYVVQEGDVLSAIAEKTGVPLERIEALNPDVDAQSLHAGQKIKLAP